jgi:hypothetical protein
VRGRSRNYRLCAAEPTIDLFIASHEAGNRRPDSYSATLTEDYRKVQHVNRPSPDVDGKLVARCCGELKVPTLVLVECGEEPQGGLD